MYAVAAVVAFAVLLGQNTAAQNDTSSHTEHFLEANGVRLHYLDWGGKGEPLVFVTGYGATAHTFDNLAPRLTGTFRVIAFTRRGTSPSERTVSGYDLQTLTSDLAAFADGLGFRRVHLAAHSFGGTEMTQFATLYPERVISLVYLDAAMDPSMGEAVMKGSPVPFPQPSAGTPYTQVLAWYASYSPDFARLKSPALAFFATMQDPIPAAVKNGNEDLRRRSDEWWRNQWLPMIQRTLEKFRREVPNAEVVTLENATHYLFRDHENDVVRAMERFYDQCCAR